jgi:chromosomal replication initiator protein
VSAELEHIWPRVQAELALAVEESAYRIWLAPLQPRELSRERVLLEAPAGAHAWIRDRFGRVIESCARRVIDPAVIVELISSDPTAHGGDRSVAQHDLPVGVRRTHTHVQDQPRSRPDAPAAPPLGVERVLRESRPGPLANPKFTFEQFVIGDGNQLAHAAALAVAELPASAYNPLFICGPPGVGKTHLLGSIAALVLSHNPGLDVRCATGESFTNEFVESLSRGQTERFKARFRDIDVLLLDDVQFLERKTRTEEELFHTFNALHDGGRQIVLTSDRPPHDLQALEDRLRERFAAGLVADIRPPDFSTRLAILRKRAQHDGVELADEQALGVIADRIDSNVRTLEGALIRVVAFSSLTRRPLTADLAREVLNTLYPQPYAHNALTGGDPIEAIQLTVSQHFGISQEELCSSSRRVRVAWPRQLAMYLARELTQESLPTIGRQFGGRDHTTVLHACRRAHARIDHDGEAQRAVENLRAALCSPPADQSIDRVA